MLKTLRFLFILLAAWSLLLIPYLGSFLNKEIQWSMVDYIIAGSLLTVVAMGIEFVLRKTTSILKKILLLLLWLLLIGVLWVELGVGIFDSPIAGN
jgi:hypothetical protein